VVARSREALDEHVLHGLAGVDDIQHHAVRMGLVEIEAARLGQLAGEVAQHPVQRPIPRPQLKPPMTRLIPRVPRRQIVPWRPCAHYPEHAVQHFARIAPDLMAALLISESGSS
jgi:hypothetical protein